MIKNYLKIAWRNLLRNKAFSIINISGLALGIACSLLIILWVQDERSVDSFHVRNSRLYNVYERQYNDGKIEAGLDRGAGDGTVARHFAISDAGDPAGGLQTGSGETFSGGGSACGDAG